jgi:hypothetical protein
MSIKEVRIMSKKEFEPVKIDYLPGNNFIVDGVIAEKYGFELAVFLGYLIFLDWSFNGKDENRWFCQTIEEMEKRIGFKRWKQDKLLKQLEELGVIEKRTIGKPPKRHFKINYERVDKLATPNKN